MSYNLRKIAAVFLALFLSLSLLSSCSSNNSQVAIVYLQDNTESRSINGNFSLFASDDQAVSDKIISDVSKAGKASKKYSNNEWNPDCDNGEGCFEINGKPLYEISVDDYFDTEEGFEVELPINEKGKVELRVTDGKYSVKWELPTSKSKELPIYMSLSIDDFTIGLNEHLNGKVTFTPVKIASFSPKNSWYFEDHYDNVSDYRAERDNSWLQFSIMYEKYVDASEEAETNVCKVFGKNCDGKVSYSSIGAIYRQAYEDVLTPMLNDLITNSDDSKVAVALLRLEKAAKLESDCYFRVYSAAEQNDSDAYSATSECFSNVRQLISDLEIYLKENSQSLRLPIIYGGY